MRGVPPQLAVGGQLNGFALPTMIDPSAGQHFCEWNLSRPHSHDLLTQSAKGMNCIPLYLLGHCCYIAFVALCNRTFPLPSGGGLSGPQFVIGQVCR
jgi:hypothetical protein